MKDAMTRNNPARIAKAINSSKTSSTVIAINQHNPTNRNDRLSFLTPSLLLKTMLNVIKYYRNEHLETKIAKCFNFVTIIQKDEQLSRL